MSLVLEHKDAIAEFNFALTKLQTEVYNNGEPKTDNDWKNIIFCSLYEGFTSGFSIIDNDNIEFQTENEEMITKHIKEWLNQNLFLQTYFKDSSFIINYDVRNDSKLYEGYYDLIIQHSKWRKNYKELKKFIFECKCLNNTKNSNSIKEYIHNPNKKRAKYTDFQDGGVFRFAINKYSENLDFGGMIGYIQDGNCQKTIQEIKEKLSNTEMNFKGVKTGQLTKNKIEDNINNNSFIFNSTHKRYDESKLKFIEPILIHHIFFDFTYSTNKHLNIFKNFN